MLEPLAKRRPLAHGILLDMAAMLLARATTESRRLGLSMSGLGIVAEEAHYGGWLMVIFRVNAVTEWYGRGGKGLASGLRLLS